MILIESAVEGVTPLAGTDAAPAEGAEPLDPPAADAAADATPEGTPEESAVATDETAGESTPAREGSATDAEAAQGSHLCKSCEGSGPLRQHRAVAVGRCRSVEL